MSTPTAGRAKTVLVVDDSELSRAVIVRILSERGFSVLTANEGAEGAVVALRELPDVVVTDLEMPVMDGYQLARLLKSDPSTRSLPLLILTSHADAPSRFWGLETGADAYLIKDELEGDLVAAVERLLERSTPPAIATAEAPRIQTPLDVLARVSRHLDSRLLEAVLVNRIFERGMQTETLQETAEAILDTIFEIVDAWLVGLAISEPDSTVVYLSLDREVSRTATDAVLERLNVELNTSPGTPCDVEILGGAGDGRAVDSHGLNLLPLPLRGARAVLAVAPKVEPQSESREQLLLSQVQRNLALVLDNARLAQRLRELSMKDGLTRLYNRRTIQQRLCEEIQRAVRYGHPLSLALCDLDHFKQINDTYGHQAGDAALVTVAEALQQQARAPDVVGRYGGEEFLILLPDTDLEDACQAARRLLRTIAQSSISLPTGPSLNVTGSLGVAALSDLDEAPSPDRLLKLADQRLYEAKAAGRNQVIP
ncbi:MAG: diguanylate cyclase [bacterium]|nr:diguanylate cyclase [bacterium]